MAKDFEYFKDFIANPGNYKTREFYEMLHEWVLYLTAHKDEFNYMEDEEWREIRERVHSVWEIKEDLRDEFNEFQEKFETIKEVDFDERVSIYREWNEFMKTNQDEYQISDADIAEMEEKLENCILSRRKYLNSLEKLRLSKLEHQRSIAELDDNLAEYYTRTGRRAVLSILQFKKRFKGN